MAQRLSIVSIDSDNGSFIIRVHDRSLLKAPKDNIGQDSPIDAFLHRDAPIDGDDHDWIVSCSYVAVSTNSIHRAEPLANEMVEHFNRE